MEIAQGLGAAAPAGAPATLALLGLSAAVVLLLLVVVVRVDPAALLRRRRHEQYVRRATESLLQEARRAQREHTG